MAEWNALEGAQSQHFEVGANVVAILQVVQVEVIKLPNVAVLDSFFDVFSKAEEANVGFAC